MCLTMRLNFRKNTANGHAVNCLFSHCGEFYLHGLKEEKRGMIRITGHIDGSRFRLCIEDNGCGMNEDTEKLMQQILMEKHTLDLAGTGIGIQNVVTRLRMYYGEELSVVLESEPEKGTKFTFWLPIPENPEKDIE